MPSTASISRRSSEPATATGAFEKTKNRMKTRKEKIESYRNRAEELRAVAETMKDGTARATLLGIAMDYDKMADRLMQLIS